MLQEFIRAIGDQAFIEEFNKTTGTLELAKFYEMEITNSDELWTLVHKL